MSEWLKWYEQPYAEDDELLNDYVEENLRHIAWKLFEHQEEIVYMANETDNGIPKLKDGAIQFIYNTINNELGWLRSYMLDRILVSYLKGNIDPSDEVKFHFNDQFELKEDVKDFWHEINDFIWEDYSRYLGEKETTKLWEKWKKEPLED